MKARVEVDPETGCWLYQGNTNDDGYGRVSIGKSGKQHTFYVHRLMYAIYVGLPVSDEMELDHVCRTPNCCNPEHLERVTSLVNSLRGEHPNFVAHRTGICRKGHPIVGDNVAVRSDGRLRCRTCQRDTARRSRARRREAVT